jgi:ribonuclease HI
VARLYATGHWLALSRAVGHAGILGSLLEKHRELSMPSDVMETEYRFERNFETFFPDREEFSEGDVPVKGDVAIFTDGSKDEGGTGAGIWCEELGLNISIPLGKYPTVFQSEALAVGESCDVATGQGVVDKDVVIYSDSRSALRALSSCKFSARSVLKSRLALETLAERNKVSLMWVPGHSGIEGNEKADVLARAGSNADFVGPEPALGGHAKLVSEAIKRRTRKEHQRRWDRLESCRQAKEFLVGCNLRMTRDLLSMDRRSMRLAVGMLTGHNTLRYHLNKMGLSSDLNCRRCGDVPETAKHFLLHCPALATLRTKHFGDFYLTLEEFRKIRATSIVSFVTGSKWLDQAST